MIVTFGNLKGGAGKSSASMLLALTAATEPDQSVVVIDADRQASAMRWHDQAEAVGESLPFDVVFLATPELQRRVDAITAGKTLTVIDTGPGDADIMSRAIEISDVVVIPACPRQDDRDQAEKVADSCKAMEIPHGVLFSRIRSSESAPDVWRADLEESGVHVLDTAVKELAWIGNAWGGRPDLGEDADKTFSRLLEEIRAMA